MGLKALFQAQINFAFFCFKAMKKILMSSLILLSFFLFTDKAEASLGCLEYGMAYEDFSGYCKCMSGYVWGKNILGEPYCVSGSSACRDDYGYGAEYDSLTGKCKCSYGYIFGQDIFGKTQCITTSQYCRDKLGFNSKYNSLTDSCECSSGYVLRQKTLGGYECVSCFTKYGLHSSYNYLTKNCECDSGYTLNANNQCVEKQNNVYFLLKEVDTTNKKAVIKSEYNFINYLITYGFGCYSWNSYKNNRVVVNLGTDYNLDTFDRIVLQDHSEVCDILSVKQVSSTFSLSGENDTSILGESIYVPTKDSIAGHSLVKLSNSSDIYAVFSQTKRKIRSIEIFNSYDWTNQFIKIVTQPYLDSLPETNLIKTSYNPNVFILAKGFKRLLASIEIFNSYGLDWNKIVTISQTEMDSYSIAPLIKYGNDLYWLDAYRIRHKFPSMESLTKNGYNTRDVIEVNDLEFGSYAEGIPINN